uniref:MFS domain-containing protein n=1 Tax=Meloidogyne hapla TaxID=6305 RepID=A0A1I8B3X6_MELHA
MTSRDNIPFKRFQRIYLLVYGLAVAGDWLQGPHVYALYQSYDLTKHQIGLLEKLKITFSLNILELLFIAGFGSSLIFGTFVGSFADKFGRKTNCLLYALLYSIGCITKHFSSFNILLIGRLLGGISTSILFSAFESWLICEHNKREFDDQKLKTIFAKQTWANSLIAILSGLVAQQVANLFGYVAPFDASFIVLILMGFACLFTWSENYGDEQAKIGENFSYAFNSIINDGRILCLGLIQSLFEGCMYVFVLEWTPVLSRAAETEKIPHGYIFSSFMLSVMAGSALFNPLCHKWKPESILRFVLFISAISLSTPFLISDQPLSIFAAFNLFELCVGIAWPTLGFLRSKYIAEKFCFLLLLLATLIQQHFYNLTKDQHKIILNSDFIESEKFSLNETDESEESDDSDNNENKIKEIIINQPLKNENIKKEEKEITKEIERSDVGKG